MDKLTMYTWKFLLILVRSYFKNRKIRIKVKRYFKKRSSMRMMFPMFVII
jgi:hypothetical protein